MSELKEGIYNGQICSVTPIEPRFKEITGFELMFEVGIFDAENKPLDKVEIYEEISTRYGVGINAQKMRKDLAMETMKKLGFTGGADFSRLGELVNKPCRINVVTKDKDGNPYKEPRCYFSFRVEAKKMDAARANALLAQMGGGFAAPAAPAPSPFNAAPATVPNPFAGM